MLLQGCLHLLLFLCRHAQLVNHRRLSAHGICECQPRKHLRGENTRGEGRLSSNVSRKYVEERLESLGLKSLRLCLPAQLAPQPLAIATYENLPLSQPMLLLGSRAQQGCGAATRNTVHAAPAQAVHHSVDPLTVPERLIHGGRLTKGKQLLTVALGFQRPLQAVHQCALGTRHVVEVTQIAVELHPSSHPSKHDGNQQNGNQPSHACRGRQTADALQPRRRLTVRRTHHVGQEHKAEQDGAQQQAGGKKSQVAQRSAAHRQEGEKSTHSGDISRKQRLNNFCERLTRRGGVAQM